MHEQASFIKQDYSCKQNSQGSKGEGKYINKTTPSAAC